MAHRCVKVKTTGNVYDSGQCLAPFVRTYRHIGTEGIVLGSEGYFRHLAELDYQSILIQYLHLTISNLKYYFPGVDKAVFQRVEMHYLIFAESAEIE